ncbi:MAG: hypothetical protein QME96_04535 [Myxococcota bacterium]|nr:hypothetical protein [Myxococcota bacterium]
MSDDELAEVAELERLLADAHFAVEATRRGWDRAERDLAMLRRAAGYVADAGGMLRAILERAGAEGVIGVDQRTGRRCVLPRESGSAFEAVGWARP